MHPRKISWLANKIMFESELEKFLSHCPNMTGEDDMRDICKGQCSLYEDFCVSIEPATEEET